MLNCVCAWNDSPRNMNEFVVVNRKQLGYESIVIVYWKLITFHIHSSFPKNGGKISFLLYPGKSEESQESQTLYLEMVLVPISMNPYYVTPYSPTVNFILSDSIHWCANHDKSTPSNSSTCVRFLSFYLVIEWNILKWHSMLSRNLWNAIAAMFINSHREVIITILTR